MGDPGTLSDSTALTAAPQMRIGFIGLGRLGAQLVERLLDHGIGPLTLYDVDDETLARFADSGAMLAASITDVAAAAPEIIGVCVQDDQQLEDVVAGPERLLAAPLATGTVIAVHSTVHPDTCRRLAATAKLARVTLIDAAISNGGRAPGDVPTRVVLVGADDATFGRCLPYFRAIGDLVEHAGPLGSGETVKLLNNLLMVVNMGTADAVIRCGEQLGIDRDLMVRVLSTASGSSQGIQTLTATERAARNRVILGKDLHLALDVLRSAAVESAALDSAGQAGLAALDVA